jgi:hypothetical protein
MPQPTRGIAHVQSTSPAEGTGACALVCDVGTFLWLEGRTIYLGLPDPAARWRSPPQGDVRGVLGCQE